MFGPGVYTESETFAGYLEQQLAGLRAAAFGLSEQQARETPCRSALSVGGLLKHAVYVMEQRRRAQDEPDAALDRAGFERFMSSFALADDETLAGVLETFDVTAASYLADVRATDPAAPAVVPPAPWDGRSTPTESVERFALMHQVEELARHAGHADLVREQLDGADAAALLMAAEGRPGNDFVRPWTPAPAD